MAGDSHASLACAVLASPWVALKGCGAIGRLESSNKCILLCFYECSEAVELLRRRCGSNSGKPSLMPARAGAGRDEQAG